MSVFSERRERKADRLRERAVALREKSNEVYEDARRMNSCIPMGQPILVGHHSERGDRRFRERIDGKMRRSVEMDKMADSLEKRAKNMEENSAIFSDDPDAVVKIKSKIDKLVKANDNAKAVNKVMAKIKTYENLIVLSETRKDQEFLDILESVQERRKFYAIPPRMMRAYYLDTSSNTAEIRRLQDRLATLERNTSLKTFSINSDKLKVEMKIEDGFMFLVFDGKPDENVRNLIKRSPNCFKWSNFRKMWTRKLGPGTHQRMINELNDSLMKISEE